MRKPTSQYILLLTARGLRFVAKSDDRKTAKEIWLGRGLGAVWFNASGLLPTAPQLSLKRKLSEEIRPSQRIAETVVCSPKRRHYRQLTVGCNLKKNDNEKFRKD